MHKELSRQVKKAVGEYESGEEAVISRDALPSCGREVTLMRFAC